MTDKALVRNAADESQVKESERRVLRGRERELNDMRSILATIQGRRLVWRWLEECGVFKSSMTGSSHTFFNEGQRNIGLKILADVNDASPESYVQMMKESKGDKDV